MGGMGEAGPEAESRFERFKETRIVDKRCGLPAGDCRRLSGIKEQDKGRWRRVGA